MDTTNQTAVVAFFALLSALAVIAGPIITTIILGRQRAAETAHKEEREDAVAKQVRQVAVTAARDQKATAAALADIQQTGRDTHALVNSDMTAALTGQLAMARLLVLASEKGTPDAHDREIIAEAKSRIAELEKTLRDRRATQAAIDARTIEVGAALPAATSSAGP